MRQSRYIGAGLIYLSMHATYISNPFVARLHPLTFNPSHQSSMKPYHPHPYSRSVGNLSSPYPTGHHNDQFSLAYNSGLLGPYYVPATPVYVGNVLAPTHSLTPSTQISSIGYTIPLPVQPALLAVQQAACIAPLNRPRGKRGTDRPFLSNNRGY